jgi:hypothetical protein
VSAQEIIAQIDALPEKEREMVFDHLRKLESADLPESFRRGMADALAGRGVEMDVALRETPPARK